MNALRSVLWDVAAVVVLGWYGAQVCPWLDGMGRPALSLNLVVAFVASQALAALTGRVLVEGSAPQKQAGRTYWLTFGRYAIVGIGLTIYDTTILHFGWISGIDLTIGALALGHFVGVDLALARERRVMDELERAGRTFA